MGVKDQYFKRIINHIEKMDYVVWNDIHKIYGIAHEGLEAEQDVYAWNIKGHHFSPKEVNSLLARGITRDCLHKRLERGMSRNLAVSKPLQNNGRRKK